MKNEMLDFIKSRRSIRSYKPDMVSDDVLDKILEAGTYAPTGGGRQSPVIIAIRDKKVRDELMHMNAEIMGKDIDPYYGAPVIVLVLANGSANTFVETKLCSIKYDARSSLPGSCSVWQKEMIQKGKQLLASWGLPDTLRGVGSIALGYPAAPADAPAERKKDYIVKFEVFIQYRPF
ncbi:MAG: nitroreductase family protein [Lachnospiraceae bacterium]